MDPSCWGAREWPCCAASGAGTHSPGGLGRDRSPRDGQGQAGLSVTTDPGFGAKANFNLFFLHSSTFSFAGSVLAQERVS